MKISAIVALLAMSVTSHAASGTFQCFSGKNCTGAAGAVRQFTGKGICVETIGRQSCRATGDYAFYIYLGSSNACALANLQTRCLFGGVGKPGGTRRNMATQGGKVAPWHRMGEGGALGCYYGWAQRTDDNITETGEGLIDAPPADDEGAEKKREISFEG